MLKVVLGIVVSILSVLLITPYTLAKDTPAYELNKPKKKKLVKKSVVSRKKAPIKVRSKKLSSRKTPSGSKKRATVRRKLKKNVLAAKTSTRKTARSKARSRTARKSISRVSASALAAARKASPQIGSHPLALKSNAVFVFDPSNEEVLYAKNSQVALPIASITKLMTALVVVEARQNMNEMLEVTKEDIDTIKNTGSRLPIGSRLSRSNMLHIALMSSENRAASALGRHYPGGMRAFVRAMNAKARKLGMNSTRYVEPTGLSSRNVSSARDLAKLVMAAHRHPLIREFSTNRSYEVETGGPVLQYRNSNRLISNPGWEIQLQKTGYISEAGRCLVMQTIIEGRPIIMVLLDSKGKYSRGADASNVRKWLEEVKLPEMLNANNEAQG